MTENCEEPLPSGTIIRRIIRGKERFYHQWRENGKTKSRYLKADEILPLREKIERRKALSAGEVEHPARSHVELAGSAAARDAQPYRFTCGVLTDKRLSELAASVRSLKPRHTLEPIVRFLKGSVPGHHLRGSVPGRLRGSVPGHLMLVQGLPQTGKTTLLRQAIRALDAAEFKTCAYMSLPGDLDARDLLADLHALADRGISRILIDGIDRSRTLYKVCGALEDTFSATGMRIVLTASQPHALDLPAQTEIVSTTFLSFSDFLAKHDGESLDDYLCCGGPGESQVDARSLRTLDAFGRRILLGVLNDAVQRRSAWSARLGNDIHKLIRRLGECLGDAPTGDDIARLRGLGIAATAEDESFVILPGLRHGLSQRLVRELLADNVAAHLGAAERKIVEETILNLVADRTLADLVLYKMMLTRKSETTEVFRVRFPHGGFDIVVADREELTCELYEVRNASERNDRQLVNLTDPDMLDTIEHRYGTIVGRTLVYSGRNAWHTSGIAYRKAEDFL